MSKSNVASSPLGRILQSIYLRLAICLLTTLSLIAAGKVQIVPTELIQKFREMMATYQEYSSEGKTVKQRKLWDEADALVKKSLKHNIWYQFPTDCYGYKEEYASDITVVCADPNNPEQVYASIQDLHFTIEVKGPNHDRILELLQDLGRDKFIFSFRAMKYSEFGLGAPQIGFPFTWVNGFKVYASDINIINRISEQSNNAEQDSVTQPAD